MLHKYRGRVTLEDLAYGYFTRRDYPEENPEVEEMFTSIKRVCPQSEAIFPYVRPQSAARDLPGMRKASE